MPQAGLDDSPFRASAESWREPRPDGLEEMRRASGRKNRRWTIAMTLPIGLPAFVGFGFLLATSIIGIYDGVPIGTRQPVVLAAGALFVSFLVFLAWRELSRRTTLGLLAVGVIAAGVWTGVDTRDRRHARADQAQRVCQERGVPEAQRSECVAEEVACITGLESGVDEPSFVFLGDPCTVDPE